jgi:hypothetical protein
VHIDLKGAAPRPEFLIELFPFFARFGFNAVLLEYEEYVFIFIYFLLIFLSMFPYTNELSNLARHTAYNDSTIRLIEQVFRALI